MYFDDTCYYRYTRNGFDDSCAPTCQHIETCLEFCRAHSTAAAPTGGRAGDPVRPPFHPSSYSSTIPYSTALRETVLRCIPSRSAARPKWPPTCSSTTRRCSASTAAIDRSGE